MSFVEKLEKEDLQVIGILNEVKRILGDIPLASERTRVDDAIKARNLLDLALRILYNEKVQLDRDRTLVKRFEKEARDMIAAMET